MGENTEHRRAFYGRRKGHPLRPQRANLIETLLPQLALDLSQPAPADLARLFSVPHGLGDTPLPDPSPQGEREQEFPLGGREQELLHHFHQSEAVPVGAVHLEIGFGGGEHLVAQAAAQADTGFIGCEPFLNGMARALSLIAEKKLANVRLYFGDAADLLLWLPDTALTGIDLLYPDPWPKRRHWKRRFIQEESVAALARVLTPGSMFRFATDWPDYAAWTLERFLRSPRFNWTAERADDWRRPWPGYTRTRYEEKALGAGRQPCYLVFARR